jgi:hypothetical protein
VQGRCEESSLTVGYFLPRKQGGGISLAEAITIASQQQSPIQLGTINQVGFGFSAIFTVRIEIFSSVSNRGQNITNSSRNGLLRSGALLAPSPEAAWLGGNRILVIAYAGCPISKTISFEIMPSRISKMWTKRISMLLPRGKCQYPSFTTSKVTMASSTTRSSVAKR